MNDNSWVELRYSDSDGDGRGEVFLFPRAAIELSSDGGRQEVLAFRRRLDIARRMANLNPALRGAFVQGFHAAVQHVTCLFTVGECLKALLKRLPQSEDQLAQRVPTLCKDCPYIRMTWKSPDHVSAELVEEAIDTDCMAAELKEKLSSALDRFSPDEATDWGMPHMLAWTLEECEGETGLTEDLLWKEFYHEKHFHRRFQQAVWIMAREVTHSVLETINLQTRSLSEIENLLGLTNTKYYLAVAGGVKHPGHPILEWATTKYLALHPADALAVADTLRLTRWRDLLDERSRKRFIFTEAKRRSRQMEITVLDRAGMFPGVVGGSPDDWQRCGLQAIGADETAIRAVLDPDFSRIPRGSSDLGAVDALLTLKRAMKEADLSLNAQRAIYARLQEIPRERAHVLLGVTKKEIAAGWRELNRKKSEFRDALLS